MFKIGSFVLTPAEVAKRKEYLEITAADEKTLRKAHGHLQQHAAAIIDRFYDYLLGHEHTRAMLSAPGLVERLKMVQTQYFLELTSGTYDLAYFENRLKVGQVHQRIGLGPEWYLGAYIKYLHIACDILKTAYGRDYETFFQTIISLTKIISLDKSLAIDAYHFAAQEGLQKSNEELKRVEAAKRQLTDMIVHDLQNPLTGISSAIQVIQSSGEKLPASAQHALNKALLRCGDLSAMILNVLQVSRAESGDLQTYMENLDLSEICREVVDSFHEAATLEKRKVVVDVPRKLPIRSDQTLLRRILQNLIRNSLRHTPKGTEVVVRVKRVKSGIHLSVIDDGPGIIPEVQAKLFEPFGAASLRSLGVRVDTGLGLPATHIMVRAVGATISVHSDGKRGTAFTVEFS